VVSAVKGFHLDPKLAKRALLDSVFAFFILLIGAWVVTRQLQPLPVLAIAGALFFFRYVQLRRRRDSVKV